MKKLLKILALLVILVVVGGGIVLYTQLDRFVKIMVETMGPKILQAPVTLEHVNLSMLSGEGSVSGLTVGNPEGFKTDNAFVLGSLKVKLDPASLMTDTIRINEILIDGPEITYEGLKGKNLKRLKENAESFSKKPGAAPAEKPTEEPGQKPAKKVIIDRLVLQNGKINYSPALGQVIPVPLPNMELLGIGEKSGGATAGQVLVQVLGQIDNVALGAVANVGKLAGDAAKLGVNLVDGAAGVGVGAVTDVMHMGTDAIGGAATVGANVLKKVPGFGGDDGTNAVLSKTAAKLTGGLTEAGGEVTGKIGEGADKLMGGVKGLLGGAKKTEQPVPAPASE